MPPSIHALICWCNKVNLKVRGATHAGAGPQWGRETFALLFPKKKIKLIKPFLTSDQAHFLLMKLLNF